MEAGLWLVLPARVLRCARGGMRVADRQEHGADRLGSWGALVGLDGCVVSHRLCGGSDHRLCGGVGPPLVPCCHVRTSHEHVCTEVRAFLRNATTNVRLYGTSGYSDPRAFKTGLHCGPSNRCPDFRFKQAKLLCVGGRLARTREEACKQPAGTLTRARHERTSHNAD